MKKFTFITICILFLLIGCQNNKPKNVIVMISDGCGYNHILATNYYQYGKEKAQIYQDFPMQCYMSTYSKSANQYDTKKAWNDSTFIDDKFTDSAASATALSTGIKTTNGRIGVDENDKVLQHFSEFINDQNKKIGTITTVAACHATPAGFTVHNTNRKAYPEIFRDMIINSNLSVMMGAGFDENYPKDEKHKYKYVGGNKSFWQQIQNEKTKFDLDNDGINDVQLRDIDNDGSPDKWTFVRNREDFLNINSKNPPKRLLGITKGYSTNQLYRNNDKVQEVYGSPLNKDVPSLAEMTQAGLKVLDNKNGFWLLIEGGAVDKAAHNNWKGRLIEEEIDFNKTVETVCKWIEENSSWDETLLIVTADHETGHLTGEKNTNNRIVTDVKNNGKGKLPEMYFLSHNHTNSLVPFFAKGCGANIFKYYTTKHDKVHGKYLDNTSLAKGLFDLFK